MRRHFLRRHFLSKYFGIAAYLLIVIGLVCPFPLAVAAPNRIHFEPLLERGGITLGYIGAIIQDKDGFIWLGGENGLVRYDGYDFKPYNHIPGDDSSLGGNTVLVIVEDKDRNLWVGTDDGGESVQFMG